MSYVLGLASAVLVMNTLRLYGPFPMFSFLEFTKEFHLKFTIGLGLVLAVFVMLHSNDNNGIKSPSTKSRYDKMSTGAYNNLIRHCKESNSCDYDNLVRYLHDPIETAPLVTDVYPTKRPIE